MTHKPTHSKRKGGVRKIKAYAEVRKDGEIVTLRIDYPMGIFRTKDLAELHNKFNNYERYQIIPITIEYSLPTKSLGG